MADEKYIAVNKALNDYFFDGRFEGCPVYLDIEGTATNEMAAALKVDPNDLEDLIGKCVAQSLNLDKPNPYIGHVKELKAWDPDKDPPPFTALLCALSIAAEHMKRDENLSETNYYERLFDLLGVTDETAKSRLKNKAKETPRFWDALELWLARNDFLLGQPTARALHSWKYVSVAMSQALVKDADRDRLSHLFQVEGLMPGEIVSEADMAFHIDRWMHTHGASGPNRWLRKLWDSGEARERVVEAALEELENWRGTDQDPSRRTTKVRLHWQLGLGGFPKKRVGLMLETRRGGQEEMLSHNSDLDTNDSPLFLEESNEPGVFCLSPVESININQLIVQPITFTGQESGIIYNHTPRTIIPFARFPNRPHFYEVPQIRLIVEHAILCNEAWLEKITEHLAERARPGYTVLRPDNIPGIPTGWCLLTGVEMMRAPDEKDEDLEALNPVASATTIACTGGLELRHGIWHSDVPPIIEAVSEKLECSLQIVHKQFPQTDEILKIYEAENGFIRAILGSKAIAPGMNLLALVKTKRKELARTSISLRSADTPAPLRNTEKQRFCHPIDPDIGFTKKPGHPSEDGLTTLEGCHLHGDISLLSIVESGNDMPASSDVPSGSLETPTQPEWQYTAEEDLTQETCVERGYHHWLIERFEKGEHPSTPKKAVCKHCQLQTWSRKKKGKRLKLPPIPAHGNSVSGPSVETDIKHFSTIVDSGFSISPDTVFDGLCYLGYGNWRTFVSMTTAIKQEIWLPSSFAADLFALGHLETNDPYHLSKSAAWSVPPPVFVQTFDGTGFLSGFHSSSLLNSISEALTNEGAHHHPETIPGQVTVHRWDGLDGLDVSTILAEVRDPHGRPVQVAKGLAEIIAHQLPSLDAVWKQAEPVHVEQTHGMQKFNVATTKWERADQIENETAYRLGLNGTRYIFRDAHGDTRQVGHRIAKILAARSAGVRLHSYDPSTHQFTATLGAEPPGLFARAIVTSSGKLPMQGDQRLTYTAVPPAVAAGVLNKMYGGEHHG